MLAWVPALVLVHELGHAVAAWAQGLEVQRIECGAGPVLLRVGVLRVRLFPLGGATAVVGGRWWQQAIVGLCGPAASLAIGAVALVIDQRPIGYFSLALGLTNLLPLPWLDGGRVLSLTRKRQSLEA